MSKRLADRLRLIVTALVLVGLSIGLILVAYPWWHGRSAASRHASAVLKSDLRNLATSQEMYFERHRVFTARLSELAHSGDFEPSEGVQVVIERADSVTWVARASIPNGVPLVCRSCSARPAHVHMVGAGRASWGFPFGLGVDGRHACTDRCLWVSDIAPSNPQGGNHAQGLCRPPAPLRGVPT